MTKKQMVTVMTTLFGFYPKGADKSPEVMAAAWYKILKPYPVEVVEAGVEAFVRQDKREYPSFPSVGQILTAIDTLMQDKESPAELWNQVYKAMCDCSYDPQKQFDRLPAVCREWVGTPRQLKELGQMNIETVNSVIRGQFIRTISEIQAAMKTQNAIPENMRVKLQGERERRQLRQESMLLEEKTNGKTEQAEEPYTSMPEELREKIAKMFDTK